MIQKFIDALIDIILWVPRMAYSWIVDAIQTMLGWIPDISIVDVQNIFDGFSGQLLYFLSSMEFGYGLTALMTALIARFILRRIPFIG